MQAKSTVKAGQGLAAAPHGEIHVLLQDKHGCLVKDYPNVQVKLELKLVDTSDDSDRVQLSQSGVAGAYALATATEGVAVFKDIVVTGMDLHSLDACLLPRSIDFRLGSCLYEVLFWQSAHHQRALTQAPQCIAHVSHRVALSFDSAGAVVVTSDAHTHNWIVQSQATNPGSQHWWL